MNLKLTISSVERTMIVAALQAYDMKDLAARIHARAREVQEDGPEIPTLRDERTV